MTGLNTEQTLLHFTSALRSSPAVKVELPTKSAHSAPMLPPPVEKFFATFDSITIPTKPGCLYLFGQGRFAEEQEGYRTLSDGRISDTWMPNWIVIGSHEGDPVIVDTSSADMPVSMATHGAASWRPEMIAPSFNKFLDLVSVWIEVVLVEYKGKIRSADGTPLPEVQGMLLSRTLKIVPDVCAQTYLKYLL